MCVACDPDVKVSWEIMHELSGNPRYLDFAKLADDRSSIQKHDFNFLWKKVGLPS